MGKEISFWEDGIFFRNGWYIYSDGKGDYSVISKNSARKKVSDYQAYQASQDVDRGGIAPDVAYPGRGFQKVNGVYTYMGNEVESLADGPVYDIPEVLEIPQRVGEFSINFVVKNAFRGEEKVKKLILHEKIKSIGEGAFADCVNLSELEAVPQRISISSDVFKNTKVFAGEQITYIQNVLIKADCSCNGRIVIKEGTNAIADNAFENCTEITEVVIPEGLRKIGAAAFHKCTGLERIIFPEKMDYIGASAFYGCTKLNHVVIPKGVEVLRQSTFEGCENLSDIQIPGGIRKIGYKTFRNTAYLKRFMESDESELYLGNWLIRYKYDENRTLKVKDGTVGVADMDWFERKALGGLILPEGLKYIGSDAFRMYGLSNITLPKGLLVLGSAAFRSTTIKEIIIPASVKKIEQWVFQNCESLERIVVEGRDTEVIWPAITDRRDGKPLTVVAYPNSSAQEYCNKYGEKYHLIFKNINELQRG